MPDNLSPKQVKFVRYYCDFGGKAGKAAIAAGAMFVAEFFKRADARVSGAALKRAMESPAPQNRK